MSLFPNAYDYFLVEEFCDFTGLKVTGYPIQAFGDDRKRKGLIL